ncbi:N-6 DNA methylase [Candidatus Woesearchaeota archaeon]|nr:N-6 DNA methylase [Candidatus Woesearchaeota archaeon]
MDKKSALIELRKLLNTYNKYKNDKEFASNEKQICKTLIEPFIENVLGWDTGDFSEYKVEYPERGKRIDMLICLDGISQFVVEAKALTKELIDNREYYSQAINYAHSKDKAFAILTNFRFWIILRCDMLVPFPERACIGTIDLEEFDESKFDELLWNFNKEVWIAKGIQNPLYSKLNLKRKIPIDEQLLEDMKKWRESILTNIKKNQKESDLNFSTESFIMEVEKEIQRLIDRLIFICYCEDKELNEPKLKSLKIDKFERYHGRPFLLQEINKLFSKYKEVYDSDLFEKGMCDDFNFDDAPLYIILEDLREPKDKMPYDFATIDADILGRTYENFIGHILKGQKRFKEEKSKGKRKEEGIFYTPQYIVNYIVNQTIREYVKNKSFEEIKKVRILDPACGSGSFLIKAFDALVEECSKKVKRELSYEEKESLLLNCIYGVDLDERACEIAKFNLSLKLAKSGRKLPKLHNNIRNGNSLIDDEKIAGRYAFKWEEQFKEIMNDGGFDVVIGNPPYGAELKEHEKQYFKQKYTKDKTGNTASLFIFRALDLLKEKGFFAYIVPKQLTYISSWGSVRKSLLEWDLTAVIDASEAFPDVELEQIMFIVRKNKTKSKKVKLGFANSDRIEEFSGIKDYFNEKIYPLWITDNNHTIFDKILNDAIPLSDIAKVNWGGPVAKFLSKEKTAESIPCIRGREIQRYSLNSEYFIKKRDIVDSYYIKGEKLLFQRIVSRCGKIIVANYRDARLNGTYCDDNNYSDKTVTLVWDGNLPLKYLLGILNSRLISWFAHRYLYNRSQLTMEFMYEYARSFPIKKINDDKTIKKVSLLVDNILSYNKRFSELQKNQSTEKDRLKKEIQKLDHEIDEEKKRR